MTAVAVGVAYSKRSPGVGIESNRTNTSSLAWPVMVIVGLIAVAVIGVCWVVVQGGAKTAPGHGTQLHHTIGKNLKSGLMKSGRDLKAEATGRTAVLDKAHAQDKKSRIIRFHPVFSPVSHQKSEPGNRSTISRMEGKVMPW